MKSKGAGCGFILREFSSIVLLWIRSIMMMMMMMIIIIMIIIIIIIIAMIMIKIKICKERSVSQL